jgi:lipoate-protein ligase A
VGSERGRESSVRSAADIVEDSRLVDVGLIIDPPLPGPWNMAVDEVLLGNAVENGVATLRFYQWSEPTLSLGYFQRYEDRAQHAASRDCAVVRRQSGGGAILHDRELTYSLIVPHGFALARNAADLYNRVHNAFIAALGVIQPSGTSPSHMRIRGDTVERRADEPFLCFQRQSPGDVILVSGSHPASPLCWKVIGSAQRRHRGAILQHGSLLVEMSPAAPELPGLGDLNNRALEVESLVPAVCAKMATELAIRLVPAQLSAQLEFEAGKLANTKYSSAVWTKRR